MSDKHQELIEELENIILSNKRENWIENEPCRDLTNINAGLEIINIEPSTALSINEVEKFTIEEDVSGKITTTFSRKTYNERSL